MVCYRTKPEKLTFNYCNFLSSERLLTTRRSLRAAYKLTQNLVGVETRPDVGVGKVRLVGGSTSEHLRQFEH